MRRPSRPTRAAAALAAGGCLAAVLAAAPASAAPAAPSGAALGRSALPAGDGWASAEGGTTGGAAADDAHVFTVRTREELARALGNADPTPKIIRVKGVIDANTAADGTPLSCDDYATDGYGLDAYLAAYDPATWGKAEPSGPLEDARIASAKRQAERVQLRVGSNTTLVGLGEGAKLLGASLQVRGADNVIIRNLTFEDAYDCFPQWDPTDGTHGEWNSEYDNLVVYGSTHVWVDHNTFTDGRRPDDAQPRHFGRLYQQHDGLFDVVRGADLVTASWNVFRDHGKTLMIGNSDSATGDRGKLRVTLHHNQFRDVGERAPRVRFGKVDAYNNHFLVTDATGYNYSWGIGVESQLHAEANAFEVPDEFRPADVIKGWKGTALTDRGNVVNGRLTDLLAAHNADAPNEQLSGDAGWTPILRVRVDDARAVPRVVTREAGADKAK
ncbi:polysaccharide lyase family 1 protein [Streptomyces capparidis]